MKVWKLYVFGVICCLHMDKLWVAAFQSIMLKTNCHFPTLWCCKLHLSPAGSALTPAQQPIISANPNSRDSSLHPPFCTKALFVVTVSSVQPYKLIMFLFPWFFFFSYSLLQRYCLESINRKCWLSCVNRRPPCKMDGVIHHLQWCLFFRFLSFDKEEKKHEMGHQ